MNQWLADRRKKLFFLIDDDVDSVGDAAAADVFLPFRVSRFLHHVLCAPRGELQKKHKIFLHKKLFSTQIAQCSITCTMLIRSISQKAVYKTL